MWTATQSSDLTCSRLAGSCTHRSLLHGCKRAPLPPSALLLAGIAQVAEVARHSVRAPLRVDEGARPALAGAVRHGSRRRQLRGAQGRALWRRRRHKLRDRKRGRLGRRLRHRRERPRGHGGRGGGRWPRHRAPSQLLHARQGLRRRHEEKRRQRCRRPLRDTQPSQLRWEQRRRGHTEVLRATRAVAQAGRGRRWQGQRGARSAFDVPQVLQARRQRNQRRHEGAIQELVQEAGQEAPASCVGVGLLPHQL
mmetsp:Transcript_103177/g.298510  ORF Transcript_103177/g.298510 Transcript_103177/m.298510 type:complete len:252 (-) Transcript_103177:285-1040(-)